METGTCLVSFWVSLHTNRMRDHLRCIEVLDQLACGHSVRLQLYSDRFIEDLAKKLGFEIQRRLDYVLVLPSTREVNWYEV